MSNEELKQNLTSSNQWLRLIYMVLFAVLLEIAGFVMLAVVIAQFLFAIFSGSANDNLRRLGDQIASYIYQTLQFLIYNSEEKPFPFSEWPESEEEDLSSYESAEEIDGEVISEEAPAAVDEPEVEETASATTSEAKTKKPRKRASTAAKKQADAPEDETVIELGADAQSAETVESADNDEKPSGEKK
ncbi:DUF4389 domain-containing protein [Microbulbifer salipaludis]|uniref:DUF4389 domain-containing protein n=1 Tax=Microbulbifer salipaludis TaxID=187980 RepID=A0ABS3E7I8_9GAMM|nr:DUF4389 domain-containing protein [Microbulbifer salipaludis]MBN8431024.1 DUF4389 domain-containing protein [Microbulbifer salipaludis]